MTALRDFNVALREQDGFLVAARSQAFDSDFMALLANERAARDEMRCSDMHHVAAVPAVVADVWAAQGTPIEHMSIKEIVARLRKDDLGAFLMTNRVT